MGGAVSSGRDNNELIDNLMGGNYIRTRAVERVFRVLDRADYMTPESRDQAYKDLAWRNGYLHLSAPCIYSEVMEGLELKPGLSFLNIGSGTGYLSTLVGLILGSGGINHGVEVFPLVVDYANTKISQFIENSPTLDEFDFCEPKYYLGNGLCLAPLQAPYDRVYCGAGCPEEYQNYFKQLIKVGGVLVMPLNDNLLQVRRVAADEWVSRTLLNVSFATLRTPGAEDAANLVRLDEQTPPRLQVLARAVIRAAMRRGVCRRHPELREPAPRTPAPQPACPRRICIPVEDDSDLEGLNELHDLDRASGANEMNALLSLVLRMGQNRVAGALRFDRVDSSDEPFSGDDDEDDDDDDDDEDDDDRGAANPTAEDDDHRAPAEPQVHAQTVAFMQRVVQRALDDEDRDENQPRPRDGQDGPRSCRVLTFELRDKSSDSSGGTSNATDDRPDETNKTEDKSEKSTVESRKSPDKTEGGVPSEVEICLGKMHGASTSREMEWEPDRSETVRPQRDSSDDETTESSAKCKEKRQKLDSGIGEENTPSSGSSPADTEPKSDESDRERWHRSDSLLEDTDELRTGRRRLQKRSRCHVGKHSSSSSTSGSGSAGDGDHPSDRHRHKRRARDGGDARRVRLSLLMKRGVKELPLPFVLKKFVNLGRCFQI